MAVVDEIVDDSKLLEDELDNEPDEKLDETEKDKPDESESEEEDKDEDDEDKETKKVDEDKPFPYERPSIAEIKEKYPTFFKDFPIFRDVVFRETEFTKVFPTIEDARESLDDSMALTGLRESVLAGKSEDIFDAIKQTDARSAEKFALTFLPTLYSKDNALYSRAITPIFENLVRKLVNSDNENTRNAAYVVAHWMWGKDGESVVDGKATFTRNLDKTQEEKNLEERERKFNEERLGEFRKSIEVDATSGRRRLISKGLDPDGIMTESQKDLLTERIEKLVDQALSADDSHIKVMNARWNRSVKEGFNSDSKEKIVSAYLSRAKQVIPSIRDKERDAFFGTKKKASQVKTEKIETRSSPKEVTSGGNSRKVDKEVLKPSRELYRKMSDMDILNS